MNILEEKLSELLRNGKDWEKKATSMPGIYVMRLPAYKNLPARLSVELKPIDAEGKPTTKRGVLIKTINELNNFKSILNDEKLANLISNIQSVNPKIVRKENEEEDIIEI